MEKDKRPARSRVRVRSGDGPPPSVDGHPGWVQQSVRQYAGVSVLVMAFQGFLAGAGPVLAGARSAAWWVIALGGLGGFLIWIPLWGMMRGEKPVSMDEAFREAYGKYVGGAMMLLYACLALFDAMISLRAVGSVVRQFLLISANEVAVILVTIGAMALPLTRHGGQGISRFIWMIRKMLIGAFVLCVFFMLQNASLDNLFPLMGYKIEDTLTMLPFAASGFTGILLLGLLPKETGSAEPVKFRAGVKALLASGLFAMLLTLVVNLCMPPVNAAAHMVWGHQLMIAAEFMEHRTIRLIYMFCLVLSLIIAGATGIGAGGMLAQSAFQSRKGKWAVLLACGINMLFAFQTNQAFTEMTAGLMWYRLPVAAAPAWITWGVLAVKRGRKEAKA